MSKPTPIPYHLKYWSITYDKRHTLSGDTYMYTATIVWSINVPHMRNNNGSSEHGEREDRSFNTFEEAKAWVDEEIKDES